MSINFIQPNKFVKGTAALMLFSFLTTNQIQAQEQEPQSEPQSEIPSATPSNNGSSSLNPGLQTSPWESASSSQTNSQDNNQNTVTDGSNSSAASGGTNVGTATGGRPNGIRRNSNSTAQRGDPGGNPDVPFDSGMNLMFLIGGLLFALRVALRKFRLKPIQVLSK